MRRIARILAALVVLATGAGCQYFYQGATPAPRAGRSVYVFGDSNVAAAGRDLLRTLAPGYDALVHGIGGSTTQLVLGTPKPWPRVIDGDLRTKLPSRLVAVVIQLGTNDCATANVAALGGVPAAIDRIMSAIPRATPVLWDNVVVPARNPSCLAVDAFLLAATSRWPNLLVQDYAGQVGNRPGLVLANTPHLSAAGRTRFAQWTRQNLHRVVP
jgi:hypothetical protein